MTWVMSVGTEPALRWVFWMVLLADGVAFLIRMPRESQAAMFVAVVLDPERAEAAAKHGQREQFEPIADDDRGMGDELHGINYVCDETQKSVFDFCHSF